MPGGGRTADAVARILDRHAVDGETSSLRAASTYTSGAGFPLATSSEDTVVAKPSAARQLEHQLDDGAVRRRTRAPAATRHARAITVSCAPSSNGRCCP